MWNTFHSCFLTCLGSVRKALWKRIGLRRRCRVRREARRRTGSRCLGKNKNGKTFKYKPLEYGSQCSNGQFNTPQNFLSKLVAFFSTFDVSQALVYQVSALKFYFSVLFSAYLRHKNKSEKRHLKALTWYFLPKMQAPKCFLTVTAHSLNKPRGSWKWHLTRATRTIKATKNNS